MAKDKEVKEIQIQFTEKGYKQITSELNKLEKQQQDLLRAKKSNVVFDKLNSNRVRRKVRNELKADRREQRLLHRELTKYHGKEYELGKKVAVSRAGKIGYKQKFKTAEAYGDTSLRFTGHISNAERMRYMKEALKQSRKSYFSEKYGGAKKVISTSISESDLAVAKREALQKSREEYFAKTYGADKPARRGLSNIELLNAKREALRQSREMYFAKTYGKHREEPLDIKKAMSDIEKAKKLKESSMSWMLSKGVITPEKQAKLNAQLKEEAKIKERLIKISNKETKRAKREADKINNMQSRRMHGLSDFVGKAMLYMGFASLGAYMGGATVRNIMAVGDATANVELDVLRGQAYRNQLGARTAGFDKAVGTYAKLSGQQEYMARSRVAQVAGSLEASGVAVGGEQLSDIVKVMRGISAGFGRTEERAMDDVLGLLSGRKSPAEVGLTGVKKSSDPNVTLKRILEFLEQNATTRAVMREGTLQATMERMRGAPSGTLARIYENYSGQMKEGYDYMATAWERFWGKYDPEVQEHWAGLMAQFSDVSRRTFKNGGEDIAKSITTALAYGIEVAGAMARAIAYGIKQPDEAMEMGAVAIGLKSLAGASSLALKGTPIGVLAHSVETGSEMQKNIEERMTKTTTGQKRLIDEKTGTYQDIIPEGMTEEEYKKKTSFLPDLDLNKLKDNTVKGYAEQGIYATPAQVTINIQNANIDKDSKLANDILFNDTGGIL